MGDPSGSRGKRVLGVIPARFGSTRLPGKPLILIHRRPLIEWVYRAAKKALPDVVIATDDSRIMAVARGFGASVVMTPKSCTSGTDRMAHVARRIPADYYVNLQGDEPLMHPSTIRNTVALAIAHHGIATSATKLSLKDRANPNVVKVVLGENKRALYFSRSLIPFLAHGLHNSSLHLKHEGLYVYPRDLLSRFVHLKPPPIERIEKLEQLRAIYYSLPMYVFVSPYESIGVDTRADLRKMKSKLKGSLRF